MDLQVFFDGWSGLIRVVVVGSLAYVALVLILRVTGKRTLSKMNAFDAIVTITLASTLATVLLSSGVALAEGVTAFLLLCILQYVVTYPSVRSSGFQDIIKAKPRLIFYRGRYLEDAMQGAGDEGGGSRRAPLEGTRRRRIDPRGAAGDRRLADCDGIGGVGMPAAGPSGGLDGSAAMKRRAQRARRGEAGGC